VMDQKSVVLYLRMKGVVLDTIHDDFGRPLGNDAVPCSTVTKYAHSAQFSGRKEATPSEAPDVARSPVDEGILTVLAEFPFSFSNYCRSSRCKACPSGTTLSPWTSRGFICSVNTI
jgi:hypothetical protein